MVAFLNSGKLNLIKYFKKEKILNQLVMDASTIFVKLCFAGLFSVVVISFINSYSKSTLFTLGKNDEGNKR